VPGVSSENRPYLPVGLLGADASNYPPLALRVDL